jgi:hypothetical protein
VNLTRETSTDNNTSLGNRGHDNTPVSLLCSIAAAFFIFRYPVPPSEPALEASLSPLSLSQFLIVEKYKRLILNAVKQKDL